MHKPRKSANQNRLRIIGGEWRGRKITFASTAGLRPTADRVRETLFNWLGPRVIGSHCLDMYAGSGALGLEALSRGAAHCDFLDTSAEAVAQLSQTLTLLSANDRSTAACKVATTWQTPRHYDLVFIDPPFADDLLEASLSHLITSDLLASDTRIYVEMPRSQDLPHLSKGFETLREKTAGEVRYALLSWQPSPIS
jgi:16S rRNA (guanine966-N2)-methyltransferase